jgi:SAM-dependent methyltransferase
MSKKLFLNIACGNIYIKNNSWVNLDIVSKDKYVKKINLLKKLPFNNETVDAIYCAHFLEHVPVHKVTDFLKECFRILKKDGVLRLVLPDFESLSKEYLKQVKLKNFTKTKIVLISIIDQCVRRIPGGELGKLYNILLNGKKNKKDLIKYLNYLNGVNFSGNKKKNRDLFYYFERIYLLMKEKFINFWIKSVVFFLPIAFVEQNISFARIGEMHHWLWDFYSLYDYLKDAGFNKIKKLTYNKSSYKDSKLFIFDKNKKNQKTRGVESMYVESVK